MRFDGIIFQMAFAKMGFDADCVSPMLAPHLPKKTNWRRMKKMSWRKKRNWRKNCICDDSDGFFHVI